MTSLADTFVPNPSLACHVQGVEGNLIRYIWQRCIGCLEQALPTPASPNVQNMMEPCTHTHLSKRSANHGRAFQNSLLGNV
eukprot:738353-Amphidinium_carterae.1